MEKTKLEMEFLDEANKKFIISIEEPKSDITPEEVSQTMTTIINCNVFNSKMLDLVKANDARIVSTTVNKLSI
jgi:ribulose 1,5-bisphosphate carboxylase large subunit-like protein